MLFNSYSYEIVYEQFHWTYLQGDIKLLLVTVNDRLKFEIVHDLSCHPIVIGRRFIVLTLSRNSPHWLILTLCIHVYWTLCYVLLFSTLEMLAFLSCCDVCVVWWCVRNGRGCLWLQASCACQKMFLLSFMLTFNQISLMFVALYCYCTCFLTEMAAVSYLDLILLMFYCLKNQLYQLVTLQSS